MAIVPLTTQIIQRAGTEPTYQGSLSISDTYTVQNDGDTFLHFKKTGAGACTVTLVTPAQAEGLAIADPTVNVPATTGDVMTGQFDRDLFNDNAGLLSFTLSEVTGLTVAAIRLPS